MMSNTPESKGITRLLRQQAALAAFGSYAFREPVLLNILNEAARVCAESLGVPFCKVCQHREVEGDLLIVAGHGWDDGVVGCVVSKADETSPQGRAYVTGEPVIIRNLAEANNVVLPAFYADHSVVSTVDVIVKGLDGPPYGVLEIDSPVQHTYDEHDVTFLTGFANVLAEAVATAGRNAALRQTIADMEAAVAEKDVLAQELKHRVRNNLQLVQSMLTGHLKSAPHLDKEAALGGIIRRVSTLSEVYEQLLGSGLSREVDLAGYLTALCLSLPRLQKAASDRVTLTCITDPLTVDLDTVTAMGMIVAELVSNSYEHAFAGGPGTITVGLRRSEGGDEGVLTVGDDGSSFVEQPGSKRHGVGLVRRLVEQVRGTAAMMPGRGTTWVFRFPVSAPAPVGSIA